MLRGLVLAHEAAKVIESDGYEGFHTVARFAGIEAATMLLVAHLRRAEGSTKSWPADPEIERKVNDLLRKEFPNFYELASRPVAAFYTEKWQCFDNFSAFAVMCRGRLVPTVEHAYQASKFTNEDIAEKILNAPSAHEAKKLGNLPEHQVFLREDWPEAKVGVMRAYLQDKRCRHEYVRKNLNESRGLYLVEDSSKDDFWGRGPYFNGKNMLGILWMEQRELL